MDSGEHAGLQRSGEIEGAQGTRQLAAWLKALAEPNRLRILDLLMQGEQCNCEMGDILGIAPNLISHHLHVLHAAGLVKMRRDADDARWIHYSIDRTALGNLGSAFSGFFDPQRIQSRRSSCPPESQFIGIEDIKVGAR